MNAKSALRDQARAQRAALARACPDFAARIAAVELPVAKGAIVSFYWPMGDEADPRALAARLAERGHVLALPVTVKKGAPLVFRAWREGDALTVHAFGMHEPAATAPEVRPDVLLVPLLAFDARGHRLGYGGGFYDRTLAALDTKLAIGVAYAGQEVETLPIHERDHPLDMVVTESGVRDFRGTGRLRLLSARQREIVRVCLRVAADEPDVFPQWEFATLFGLTRAEVASVADAWPDCGENTSLAIGNALNNLLGYPHDWQHDWDAHFAFTKADLAATLAAWHGDPPARYLDALL
ncbi:MAG TPA: 5-formyltetrahydrofolate cyclo-ligase [Rhizomicrobium sp.]|nr:5-formyltetrahydrofolate cyclo-ligase [Rhizomicrobium sp.]